jgi:parallel beta-helix repeat protein
MVRRKIIISIMLTIAIFFSFLFISNVNDCCKAAGNTLNVGIGQTYSTIQDAINDALTGDTVFIHSGTYNENILINKSISLIGESKSSTIITGSVDNQNTIRISKLNYNDDIFYVNLSELTIGQNPTAKGNSYSVLFIEYAEICDISNCIIQNGYNGIYIKHTINSTISENTIKNNDESGLLITTSSKNNIIDSNIIENNNIGIYIQTLSTNNQIFSNTISDNSWYGLRILGGCNSNVIHHNVFDNEPGSIDNANDAATNTYDDGSEGNSWDDYTGTDTNGDGIGETVYNIAGGSNQDQYPLVESSTNHPPVADAGGPYSELIDIDIIFDASGSYDSDGAISSYRWDFTNDGIWDTDWLGNPTTSYSYSSPGIYTVKLQVMDDGGKTKTDTATVEINDISTNNPPVADVGGPYQAYVNVSVSFNASKSEDDVMVTGYRWDFTNDGIWDTDWLTSYFYSYMYLINGSYVVKLQVKDGLNETDTDTAVVIINTTPASNIEPIIILNIPSLGIIGNSIDFDGSECNDPDGEIVNFSWNFGDGNIAYGDKVSNSYENQGQYEITLIITDDKGAKTMYLHEITINPASDDTPGFEIIFVLIGLSIFLFWKKRKK